MIYCHEAEGGRCAFLASELASELYVDERVDKDGRSLYLDIPLSVSGLRRDEHALGNERFIDEFSVGDPQS